MSINVNKPGFSPTVSVVLSAMIVALPAHGLPQNMTLGASNAPSGTIVVAPTIAFSPDYKQMTVLQDYGRMVLNWESFSIAADEVVRFQQPDSASAVLNRVTGGGMSSLLGRLEANGSVFLINPNGVVIGAGGVIHTGGTFVASTRDVSNSAFIGGGDLNFLGDSAAGVQNLGLIKSDHGDVVLVGRAVSNAGTIEALAGRVGLAAGDDVLLSSTGSERLSVRLPATVVETGLTGVDNAGTVRAAQAQLTAAGGNVYALAISSGGVIEATGVTPLPDGRIVLTSEDGDISLSGQLTARDADGSGGAILVGGGLDGGAPVGADARNLTVSGATVNASASAASIAGGGRIVLRSSQASTISAGISARGGDAGGDGGTVEITGARSLVYNGVANLGAVAGEVGQLSLNANTVSIGAQRLVNQLALADLTITTQAVGADDGDITVFQDSVPIYASTAVNDLTLNAGRDINWNVSHTFQSTNQDMGAFTFEAGRDINILKRLGYQLVSQGADSAIPAPGAPPAPLPVAESLTGGGLHLTAAGDINLTGDLQVSATSRGGRGSHSAHAWDAALVGGDDFGLSPGAVGERGGDVSLGGVSLVAGGDITITGAGSSQPNILGFQASSEGGLGGDGYDAGTGGAGGAVDFGGIIIEAGGDVRTNAHATLNVTASSEGGDAGAALNYQNDPTAAGNGGHGGVGGAVDFGDISVSGRDLDLNHALQLHAQSIGGRGTNVSVSGVGDNIAGTGGAGGSADIGSITYSADRDILSIGAARAVGNVTITTLREVETAGSQGPSNQLPILGGPGGAAGEATVGNVLYVAGRDLFSNANENELTTSSSLTLIAGRNLTLTGSTLHSDKALTLVADNAQPDELTYGHGEISLADAVLTGGDPSLVRLYGVHPDLVDLGSFTPYAVGVENQYFGDADATGGGLYYKRLFNYDPLHDPASGPVFDQLFITANNISRIYGFTTMPAFSANFAGFVNGDSAADVTGLQFSTTASLGANVGNYVITPYGASAPGNYALRYIPGVFSITPARLDLRGNAFTMTYGDGGAPSVNAVGLVNGDQLADVASVLYGYGSGEFFTPFDFSSATVRQYDYATNSYVPWTYDYPVQASLLTGNYVLGDVTGGTFSVTPRAVVVSMQGFDISRAIGTYDNGSFTNGAGRVDGNRLTIYAGDNALLDHEINGGTLRQSRFVVTFDGMKSTDLAQSTAQNFSLHPIIAQQNGRPVITGLRIAPGWNAASNYTFSWVQPTLADLNFLPYTQVAVTAIDIATITGNPRLYPVYAFTGSGLGALDGLDLTSNRFGYVTNWNSGSQSGVYWYAPTLPASVDPGGVGYPSSATDSPHRVELPFRVNLDGSVDGVFWWNSRLSGTDLLITRLDPAKVSVYNIAGDLNTANNQARGDYWALRAAEDETADDETQVVTGKKITGVATMLLVEGNGNPRFNLSSGSVLGYPAYQAPEVHEAVKLFLQRSGQAADTASVNNWILQNNTEAGRQAIFGIMTEMIMGIASTTSDPRIPAQSTPGFTTVFTRQKPARTPGQQALLDSVADAIRSNRIAAYEKVEADYKAWQDDVRRAKEGKMPTLYSLVDIGDTPPDSLYRQLGLAKTGLSDAELAATGTFIGTAIGATSVAAGLTGAAASTGAAGTTGALMPFATSTATSMAASGPAIAATFVAVVAADAAVKVMKIEQFKDDLGDLRERAYDRPTVEGTLANGTIGQAEILNALRELNGW